MPTLCPGSMGVFSQTGIQHHARVYVVATKGARNTGTNKTQPPRCVAADAHDNVYSAAPYISVCIEQRSMCLSFALASEIFLEKGFTVPLLGTQYTFLNMCLFVLPGIACACACFFFPGPPPAKGSVLICCTCVQHCHQQTFHVGAHSCRAWAAQVRAPHVSRRSVPTITQARSP